VEWIKWSGLKAKLGDPTQRAKERKKRGGKKQAIDIGAIRGRHIWFDFVVQRTWG
jgi:hypothetical protein